MASSNLRSNGSSSSFSSSLDNLLIQSLMSRLQLRLPCIDTNSLLSLSLDNFLLPKDNDDDDEEEDEEDELGSFHGDEESQRKLLAKEEAKLEKEIIRIVHSGNAHEVLKANSGQSVAIGDHNICVGVHEELGSEYRVWEWHGHIMFFDEEDGYSAEYIYGNYFESLPEKKRGKMKEEEEEEESKVKGSENLGLRDLIGDSKDLIGGGGGRVLHRNSLNAGSAVSK